MTFKEFIAEIEKQWAVYKDQLDPDDLKGLTLDDHWMAVTGSHHFTIEVDGGYIFIEGKEKTFTKPKVHD